MSPRVFVVLACLSCTIACTAAQKRPAVATALDSAETRRESIEATLRVLDDNPEYVDEFFQLALQHPRTLDRLLRDTSLQIEDEAFARRVAGHLARSPAGLRTTLIATLDAVQEQPEAADAAAQAIEERPAQTVEVLAQRDAAVRRTIRALVQRVQHDTSMRQSFLAALDENRQGTAAVLVTDSGVLVNVFKAVGSMGMKRGKNELQAFVDAMGEKDE